MYEDKLDKLITLQPDIDWKELVKQLFEAWERIEKLESELWHARSEARQAKGW